MCYSYSVADLKAERLGISYKLTEEQINTAPLFGYSRVKALPTDLMPVIVQNEQPRFEFKRWGIIPPLFKESIKDFKYATFNGRVEDLAESKLYFPLLNQSRCIIPADWFFESLHFQKFKIPYKIGLKSNKLMLLAGLHSYNPFYNIESFTILTIGANKLVSIIHDKERMPVILTSHLAEDWLNPNIKYSDIQQVLNPFPDNQMIAYSLGQGINKLNANNQNLLIPFDYRMSSINSIIEVE